jgi:excisionase family DNA binding protein
MGAEVSPMLLTPREVAECLSVSVRTVYSWLEAGRLPAVRLSERVTRVPSEAVDALVADAIEPATVGPLAAEDRALYCPTCGGAMEAETVSGVEPSERLLTLVRDHRDAIVRIAAANHAGNVRLFGSVARGDARDDSDIDLLVDLDEEASLFDLAGIGIELSDLLGQPVDVVPASGLKQRIRDRVLGEAVDL